MKLVLVGGHVTPALAIIDELPKDIQVLFIGRKFALEGDKAYSLEYTAIHEKKIPFTAIETGRLQRKITRHTIPSLAKIPIGFLQAIRILRKYSPDAVLSFGGYLSVPVGLAAHFLGIPLIIHEQTLEAGFANKILAKFAARVCISWGQSASFFQKEKTVLTGNPIRKFSIFTSQFSIPQGHQPLIYITGGSTGAHAINMLVESCLENLLEKYRIIHQTGDTQQYRDYDRLYLLKQTLPLKLQKRYVILKSIDPYAVGSILKDAAFVISRSGMNTVTELLYFAKPCLLIPLPTGQRNEQLKNALFLKKIGIGDYKEQSEINSHQFFAQIEYMMGKRSQYQSFSNEAKSCVRIDAAKRILAVIYEVISQKK